MWSTVTRVARVSTAVGKHVHYQGRAVTATPSFVLCGSSPRIAPPAVLPTPHRWMSSTAVSPSPEFLAAKEAVTKLPAVDNTTKLQLYALFKQATEGDCNAPKPGMLDMVGKAKWSAWTKLAGTSPAEAEAGYIGVVRDLGADLCGSSSEDAPAEPGTYTAVTVENRDKVFTITLNRPARFNAYNWAMYDEVKQALAEAADSDASICVITGAGHYFSSGNDLANFDLGAGDDPMAMASDAAVVLESFVEAFIAFPKPLVAAVNGPAIGIGATTLGLCDIVYSSHTATFQTPFSALGQSPEACSSYVFPRLFGAAKANDVLIGGRKITAPEARDWGLVTDVFEASTFREEVEARVAKLAAFPPLSMRYTKALTRDAAELAKLRQVNKAECERLLERWTSDECAAAVAAFLARKA